MVNQAVAKATEAAVQVAATDSMFMIGWLICHLQIPPYPAELWR
jgi:hypothetical protein